MLACAAICGCSKPNSSGQPGANASAPLKAEPRSGAPPRASVAPPGAVAPPASAVPAAVPAFALLPEACREPRVMAANAPLSALGRPGWNWPWVTQTVLAYEARFVFEPSEIAADRRVTLHQRELRSPTKAPGRAELVAVCKTPGTCNELAKVLRDSIPGNQATPYCDTQPEPGAGLQISWMNLLPPLPESYVVGRGDRELAIGPRDVEKECVRWAVCSHQQEPSRSVELGLQCLKDPNKYQRERRCASGPSCFDVAACAGQGTRAGPELPLWREFYAETDHREAFWMAGRQLYSPGGSPLEPSALYEQTVSDVERWQKQKSPGRWFIVATGYDASNPTEDGSGARAMQSTSGSWQLQYVTLDGTVFGPVEKVSGSGDEVNMAPAFHSSLGSEGGELLYDYDADGVPEVGVYYLSWHHVMPSHLFLRVWTVKQGRIVPYEPADALPGAVVGVTHIGGDDRPDLLLDSRHEFFGPEGGNFESHTSLSPDGVAHALPNGTFSTTDAVAKRWK